MGKSTINGHFQKQTVKLPEGIFIALHLMNLLNPLEFRMTNLQCF